MSGGNGVEAALMNVEKYLDQLVKSHAIQINIARKVRDQLKEIRETL